MYEYKAIIKKVIDGDTVDVDIDLGLQVFKHDERLRLFGIDTAELRSSNTELKELAQKAKARLQELLPEGTVVTLNTLKDSKEKYGRYLGLIVLEDGRTVNDILIKEELATEYFGGKK